MRAPGDGVGGRDPFFAHKKLWLKEVRVVGLMVREYLIEGGSHAESPQPPLVDGLLLRLDLIPVRAFFP